MNGKRRLFIGLIIMSLVMLTGCWDYKDIEETSVNVGLGLDLADPESNEIQIKGENPVIMSTIQTMEPKQTSGGEGKIDYKNTSVTSNTLSKTIIEVALFNRGPLIGQHLKVTLIGEELAKRMNLRNLLSYLMRNSQIRLGSTILCTKGTARHLLEGDPKIQQSELPAFEIIDIANNYKHSLRMLEPMTYGLVGRFLASNQSFLLPCIVKRNDEIVVEDAAVISGKNKRIIGFLNDDEIAGVNWITGKKGGGLLNVYRKEGETFSVKIYRMSGKITPHVEGNRISFDVSVKTEGYLTEDWIEQDDDEDPKLAERLEKEAVRRIIYQMRSALYKMQKVYHTDVAGFGDALRIYDARLWQRIKKDWEDKWFPDVPIRISVDMNLQDFGVKTKDQ
jgi:spore germination protein